MKKYLFLVSNEENLNYYLEKLKGNTEYEANFILIKSTIYHSSNKDLNYSKFLDKKIIDVKKEKYNGLPKDFYILNPGNFNSCINKINKILKTNKYDCIINAFNSDIFGALLFQQILDTLNIVIPDKTINKNTLVLEDNQKCFSNIKNEWLSFYGKTINWLAKNIGNTYIVKKDFIKNNYTFKKDDSVTLSCFDGDFNVYIQKEYTEAKLTFYEFNDVFL